jgi:hypothetical protein
LKKTNKIENSLANLTKMKREKNQINKIRNKKGEITTKPKKLRESSETTLRTCIPIQVPIWVTE